MSTPDPLANVQALVQRLADDAQQVAKEATSAIQRMADEGIDVTHEAVQVALDSITYAREQVEKASHAVGRLGK